MTSSINEKQVAQSDEKLVAHADNKQFISTPDAPLSVDSREHHPIDTKNPHNGITNEKDLDRAYLYMNEHATEAETADADAVDLVRLRRKIDWRIVPIMFAAYTMQFIDKVMINVSCSL